MISSDLEQVLQHIYIEARTRYYELIGIEHLLLGLIEKSDEIRQLLQTLRVDTELLSQAFCQSRFTHTRFTHQ